MKSTSLDFLCRPKIYTCVSFLLKLKFVNPDPLAHLRFTDLVDSPVKYFQCGFEKLSLDELTENK
jgi:hypothetical protein